MMQIKKQQGNTLIEIIVAIGLFVVILPSIMLLILGTHGASLRAENRLEASAYARQAYEALKAIRDYSWQDLQPGTYGLTDANGFWQLQESLDNFEKYHREIQITQQDAHTKKFLINVSWEVLEGTENHINLHGLLTDWDEI